MRRLLFPMALVLTLGLAIDTRAETQVLEHRSLGVESLDHNSFTATVYTEEFRFAPSPHNGVIIQQSRVRGYVEAAGRELLEVTYLDPTTGSVKKSTYSRDKTWAITRYSEWRACYTRGEVYSKGALEFLENNRRVSHREAELQMEQAIAEAKKYPHSPRR